MKTSFYTNYSNINITFQSKTSAITTERLQKLVNSGKTVQEIRAELGIAADTYYKLLRERGITYNAQELSAGLASISKQTIEQLLKAKNTVPQICNILKITQNAYYKLAERFGIINPATKLRQNAALVTKEALLTAVNQRLSVNEICKKFGITPSVYYNLISKFEIQTPKKKSRAYNAQITKERILELLNSGKKYNEVLEILNINSTAYNTLLSQFGIVTGLKKSKQNISNVTKKQLESLITSGKKVKEICQELNISERTYTRLLDKFGIETERQKSKKHIASITRETLQELVDKGFSVNEICNQLKINNGMFYRLLKELHINYNYQHHFNEILIPEKTLEEYANSGKTTAEIGNDLGIAVTTFHHKVKEASIKTVFRDSIDTIASISKEEFQKLIDSGMSVKEICEKLGITSSTYKVLMNKYYPQTSLRRSADTIAQIDKKQLLELKNSGKTVKEICTELNISKSTYQRILKRN